VSPKYQRVDTYRVICCSHTLNVPDENSSPYQTVLNQQDRIAQLSDGYKFLNGKQQGTYENDQLKKI
jgi:hypothetical protein